MTVKTMRLRRIPYLTLMVVLIAGLLIQPKSTAFAAAGVESDPDYNCLASQWRGDAYGLKDHSIFYADGYYYGVSIYLSAQDYEDQFAYARSTDLCTWTELAPVLTERRPGTWDEFRIWAPHVIQGNTPETADTYFMFYTGVTQDITQSTMLATTTTPADPASWQPQGMVFQPNHPGMDWAGRGAWSDARDPMLLFSNGRYYQYYTGLDVGGGIVGIAVADSLYGPWTDLGATVTTPGAMPESPTVLERNGFFFLVYNLSGDGTGPQMVMGPSPTGPWSAPWTLSPGWAHEFFQAADGTWITSYLTDLSVTIDAVYWEQRGSIQVPALRIPPKVLFLPQLMAQ